MLAEHAEDMRREDDRKAVGLPPCLVITDWSAKGGNIPWQKEIMDPEASAT